MMAITHHMIIRYAAYLVQEEPLYCVLGDDALIVGDNLFKSYKMVCDHFRIELNMAKTFKSKDLFEFAKRFFYKGIEISPFPVGALIQSRGDVALMSVAIDNAYSKSWFPGWDLNGNPVYLFSRLFECFGVGRYKSYSPARKL